MINEMLKKMIQSKNYQIFCEMKAIKKEKEEGIAGGLIKEETESEPEDAFSLQEVSDENSDDVGAESSGQSTVDAMGNRIPRKLKPSGVVSQIMIDPDETSDDENDPVKKMMIKEEIRAELGNTSQRSSQLELEQQDTIKQKRD